MRIGIILTSPLKHAVQTARILTKVLGIKDGISVCNELAPEGSRVKLYEKLHDYASDSSILIVGHKPYLSDLMYEITFHENRHEMTKGMFIVKHKQSRTELSRGIILKKAGLAKVRLISLMPTLRGEVRWLMTSRILKRLQGAQL